MKNKEKYIDEIIEMFVANYDEAICQFRIDKIFKDEICYKACCEECNKRVEEWLEEEYQEHIKLTEAEKVILENVDERGKWISRDKNGDLFIYEGKPKKSEIECVISMYISRFPFKQLFQFIKWEDEEPYNIDELLENCEVLGNE